MSNYISEQHHASRQLPLSLGINIGKPMFPQYALKERRLESFETWPEYLPVAVNDLAEAGLVYTGVGDSVRCYHCGGGLLNWEPDDDPMKEHAKWYPACPHLLLLKGKSYIEKVRNGEPLEADGLQNDLVGQYEEVRCRVDLICYYCGEHVDNHDLNQRPDPWRAHLSASSKCFHNILMRGDDFILSDKLDSEADGHIIGKGIKRSSSCQTNAPKKMKTASGEVLDCYLYPVPRERQRCDFSQRIGNEHKHRQHQTLYSRTQNRSPYRPNESFDDSYTCFTCKVSAGKPDLVLTLCCKVWVCFECAKIDQCPKCYRSHSEVSVLNNQMDCD